MEDRPWSRRAEPSGDEPESDADLWHRLRAADELAFRELFVRHRNAVYNFAFRRTASWSVAEDVVQSTFAALWRRALRGDVDTLRLESARPALVAMARGECSNATRSGRRHLQLVDRVAAASPATAADNTAGWVEAESTMAQIRALLASLPASQREVVELVAWAELPMSDVSAILNVPVGTVKSRLARARIRLLRAGAGSLLTPAKEGPR